MSQLLEKRIDEDEPGKNEDRKIGAAAESISEARTTISTKPKTASPWRRRFATLAASLLLIAAVVGILLGIGYVKTMQIQASMSAPPPPEMPVAVRLQTAITGEVIPKTTVVGTVLAPQMIVLRNEEPGTVTEVMMKPGGTIAKGEVMLRMDTRVEQAELEAAQATMAQAKATLRRGEKLFRTSAISGEELDAAIASAARARADADRLRAIIDRKELRAPFDAGVGLFQLHVGQYLDVGSEIVTLQGKDTYLHVDFSVPAHVADSLAIGCELSMRIDGGQESFAASVAAMDSRSDAESRLLMVRARVDSPPTALVPGDSVLVTVPYGTARTVVLVPRTSVRRGPTGDQVFIAKTNPQDDSLRANLVVVTVVGSDDSNSQIIRGLSPGDRVVADGSFKVMDGSLLADVVASDQPLEIEGTLQP